MWWTTSYIGMTKWSLSALVTLRWCHRLSSWSWSRPSTRGDPGLEEAHQGGWADGAKSAHGPRTSWLCLLPAPTNCLSLLGSPASHSPHLSLPVNHLTYPPTYLPSYLTTYLSSIPFNTSLVYINHLAAYLCSLNRRLSTTLSWAENQLGTKTQTGLQLTGFYIAVISAPKRLR